MEYNTEIININSKDIVIVRFDVMNSDEVELLKLTSQLRKMINEDHTIASRFICLQDGIDLETLSEGEFIEIWKAKYGDKSFEKADSENPNQMSLFNEGDIDK